MSQPNHVDLQRPSSSPQPSNHGQLDFRSKYDENQAPRGLGPTLSSSPESFAPPKGLPPASTQAPSLEYDSILHKNLSSHHFNAERPSSASHYTRELSSGGLHIRTDLPTIHSPPIIEHFVEGDDYLHHTTSNPSLPRRTLSSRHPLRTTASTHSLASATSSPQLAAMTDITPLPSPIVAAKDNWKFPARSRSRASSTASNRESATSATTSTNAVQSSPTRRKPYHGLKESQIDSPVPTTTGKAEAHGHERSRSVSDYVPAALVIPKPRTIAVSGSSAPVEVTPQSALHREEYLAVQRGVTTPIGLPPSQELKFETNLSTIIDDSSPSVKRQRKEIYTAVSIASGKPRRYKSIRLLGQGTFSEVFLAVRENESDHDGVDYTIEGTSMEAVKARSKRLVAVKIIEHGPAGGADEERIEVSLKREVEILRAINHPSLVHLRAFGAEEQRALLVLNFCPGGDMFEVASTKLDLLVPTLVRRIFSELVSAVQYLHLNYIVHRDIKLENVLLNLPVSILSEVWDWQTLDRAVVTLTDMGLSRRIPEPPESPLLTTRCGSEDYAAPEILMGQAYDGRQTDAWALGVMLYSLMEGRLPFDPLPGARGDPAKLRARTPHRIARCEWAWFKFGDENGDWDPEKGKDYDGARICVDSLLKRISRRKELSEIAQLDWVKDGIMVEGGLSRDDDAI